MIKERPDAIESSPQAIPHASLVDVWASGPCNIVDEASNFVVRFGPSRPMRDKLLEAWFDFAPGTGGMSCVESKEEASPAETAIEYHAVSERVAEIQTAFSPNISELAQMLRVERPTVYSWLQGKMRLKPANEARLRAIFSLARKWSAISELPVGSCLQEKDEQGRSLLDLLCQETLPEGRILSRFKVLRSRVGRSSARGGLREALERRGLDLSKMPRREHAIDALTGRRTEAD